MRRAPSRIMQLSKNLLAPVLSALMILAGCRKEAVSPVDPKPFPSDGNKDLTVAPGDDFFRYCNGTVTLEENIADLGGVNIALDAYTEHLTQQGFVGSVLKDQQRKFFESYADIWCCLYGKELIESRTGGKRPDKHALPRERVNGIVMNIDLWYELYNVTRENLLYLPPERRTHIW